MKPRKTPAQYIREDVFGIETQKEFGDLLGYGQGGISRFESGARRITVEFQFRVRAAAKQRQIKWDDNWFFDVPTAPERRVA